MVAQFLGAAFMLLGMPVAVAQTAASTGPGAQAEGKASAAKPAARPDAQTQRIRELIYFFRSYRVFIQDEEWARTIRELATIGKPAVPELIAELDRTDRDATLRSLAFCLRAIGDERAIPALVRAIPKALRPPGSDCGVNIVDPDLRRFMLAHQNYKNDTATHVACGRPVNEIFSAIERISKHSEPPDVGDRDPLRHVFLGGTAEQKAQQLLLFLQRQKLWETWWSEHWREFVTQEQLQSVELPKRDTDVVEIAGLARFGALFPTGPQVRLGPVRMLRLTNSAYWNGKSYLDLDTGRVFRQYEGLKATDWEQRDVFGSRIGAWYRQNGIDVRYQGSFEGVDVLLWLVDDSRWDTIEADIRKNETLVLGREATGSLARFVESRTDFKYDDLATFLFTTRERGRGIIQVFPKDKNSDQRRLRYRMWLSAGPESGALAPPVAEVPAAKTPGTPFAKPIATTLDPPGEGREFLLDLATGRKAVAPKILKLDQIAESASLLPDDQFTRWCRDQGIDVFNHVSRPTGVAPLGIAAKKAAAGGPEIQLMLIGLDMVEARVLPESFDALTVEEVREILDRVPSAVPRNAWMMIDAQLAERPDTFAFKTRQGTVGLLQIEADETGGGKLKVRYRVAPRE